ncbi:hypothetical protein XENTR_v10019010 [Xenopus tropicalis]|nr:hypothetical protein XENTR_v10019010 [Xenopus tropicalis]
MNCLSDLYHSDSHNRSMDSCFLVLYVRCVTWHNREGHRYLYTARCIERCVPQQHCERCLFQSTCWMYVRVFYYIYRCVCTIVHNIEANNIQFFCSGILIYMLYV